MLLNIQNILQEKVMEALGQKSEIQEDSLPMYSTFKLPIHYLDSNVYKLSDDIITDLELSPIDSDEETDKNEEIHNYKTKTMYDFILNPENEFSRNMILTSDNMYYTTNIEYLEDTQNVINNIKKIDIDEDNKVDCERFMMIWRETKENSFFLEKYCYMDWEILKPFNKSSAFLQIMSVINMSSPVLSFIIPIIFLVMPFIILKIQGIPINFNDYINVLKMIAKNHFIGKMINIKSLKFDTIMYILFTIGLYGLQVYQNINICIRFYKNINFVNDYLFDLKKYLKTTVSNMKTFIKTNSKIKNYKQFCIDIEHHANILNDFRNVLPNEKFSPSIMKITEIGYLLKMFYELHSNISYEKSLKYSVGFNGYIHHLHSIYKNVQNDNLNYTKFNTSSKTKIKEQYYPSYVDKEHIKNNCIINKNIITGPNASGKTTLLKTTALNIIFSQQYGVGFYKSCTLNPYAHIHSYLNIPDTSGRDSLFQAESRRCKEILTNIQDNPNDRHFTIFDELFSGTNPTEATKSAYAFLLYLSQYDNVDYVLTTHYTSICKKLEKKVKLQNYKMDVHINENGNIKYTYRIKKGISKIQGATLILEEMKYPNEIIDTIKNYK